jgi:hypothetical protein
VGESASGASAQAPQDGPADVAAWLASVRRTGGWRLDPARFHYMEALARRMSGLPEPVRGLLEHKLRAAATHYAARLAPAPSAPAAPECVRGVAAPVADATSGTPLRRLNEYIRVATAARRPAAALGEPQNAQELASVRRFRQARERSRTLDQVEHAAARKPANAGPLNSHALVLHSLGLMRELSPDYLRRFLVHMESLQWLDQAREKLPSAAGKQAKPAAPARRIRSRK